MLADCDDNRVISYQLVSDLLFILWISSHGQYDLVHVPVHNK